VPYHPAKKQQITTPAHGEPGWHVCTHDWPVGNPLDPELVRRVLANFDRYYDGRNHP
jgi:hypothetical protein